MRLECRVAAIVPALDEELAIAKVLSAVPRWVDEVVVVDNGSVDATAERARRFGARVVREPRRGYGAACLAGLRSLGDAAVVVFLDADFSDFPEQMDRLVDPIVRDEQDLVMGSRVTGSRVRGALAAHQRVGNSVACYLMHRFWGVRCSDLGPFRAIRAEALKGLGMRDRGCGWTIEMQIKAHFAGLRVTEVPVSYRPRIGRSKISGTLTGSLGAGAKILSVIARHLLRRRTA